MSKRRTHRREGSTSAQKGRDTNTGLLNPQLLRGRTIYEPAGQLRIWSNPWVFNFAPRPRREAGGFRLTVQGPPERTFQIQRSSDLMNWRNWTNGIAHAGGDAGVPGYRITRWPGPFLSHPGTLTGKSSRPAQGQLPIPRATFAVGGMEEPARKAIIQEVHRGLACGGVGSGERTVSG